MNNSNWDDFRFVLAAANEGSFNAAAKSLGVTHATVIRRVAAFEKNYGQSIFKKSSSGAVLLPEARRILEATRNIEDAVLSVERTMRGAQEQIEGRFRIATTDSICHFLLPKIVTEISAEYPELNFTLLSANNYHDLENMSADIAIRPVTKLQEGLVGEVAGKLRFGVYAATPEVEGWIGLDGSLLRSVAANWMSAKVPQSEIRHTADSFNVLAEMAASGQGKTVLPVFVGDRDPRLVRISTANSEVEVPVWVASLGELAASVRFRTVRQIIARELGKALDSFGSNAPTSD